MAVALRPVAVRRQPALSAPKVPPPHPDGEFLRWLDGCVAPGGTPRDAAREDVAGFRARYAREFADLATHTLAVLAGGERAALAAAAVLATLAATLDRPPAPPPPEIEVLRTAVRDLRGELARADGHGEEVTTPARLHEEVAFADSLVKYAAACEAGEGGPSWRRPDAAPALVDTMAAAVARLWLRAGDGTAALHACQSEAAVAAAAAGPAGRTPTVRAAAGARGVFAPSPVDAQQVGETLVTVATADVERQLGPLATRGGHALVAALCPAEAAWAVPSASSPEGAAVPPPEGAAVAPPAGAAVAPPEGAAVAPATAATTSTTAAMAAVVRAEVVRERARVVCLCWYAVVAVLRARLRRARRSRRAATVGTAVAVRSSACAGKGGTPYGAGVAEAVMRAWRGPYAGPHARAAAQDVSARRGAVVVAGREDAWRKLRAATDDANKRKGKLERTLRALEGWRAKVVKLPVRAATDARKPDAQSPTVWWTNTVLPPDSTGLRTPDELDALAGWPEVQTALKAHLKLVNEKYRDTSDKLAEARAFLEASESSDDSDDRPGPAPTRGGRSGEAAPASLLKNLSDAAKALFSGEEGVGLIQAEATAHTNVVGWRLDALAALRRAPTSSGAWRAKDFASYGLLARTFVRMALLDGLLGSPGVGPAYRDRVEPLVDRGPLAPGRALALALDALGGQRAATSAAHVTVRGIRRLLDAVVNDRERNAVLIGNAAAADLAAKVPSATLSDPQVQSVERALRVLLRTVKWCDDMVSTQAVADAARQTVEDDPSVHPRSFHPKLDLKRHAAPRLLVLGMLAEYLSVVKDTPPPAIQAELWPEQELDIDMTMHFRSSYVVMPEGSLEQGTAGAAGAEGHPPAEFAFRCSPAEDLADVRLVYPALGAATYEALVAKLYALANAGERRASLGVSYDCVLAHVAAEGVLAVHQRATDAAAGATQAGVPVTLLRAWAALAVQLHLGDALMRPPLPSDRWWPGDTVLGEVKAVVNRAAQEARDAWKEATSVTEEAAAQVALVAAAPIGVPRTRRSGETWAQVLVTAKRIMPKEMRETPAARAAARLRALMGVPQGAEGAPREDERAAVAATLFRSAVVAKTPDECDAVAHVARNLAARTWLAAYPGLVANLRAESVSEVLADRVMPALRSMLPSEAGRELRQDWRRVGFAVAVVSSSSAVAYYKSAHFASWLAGQPAWLAGAVLGGSVVGAGAATLHSLRRPGWHERALAAESPSVAAAGWSFRDAGLFAGATFVAQVAAAGSAAAMVVAVPRFAPALGGSVLPLGALAAAALSSRERTSWKRAVLAGVLLGLGTVAATAAEGWGTWQDAPAAVAVALLPASGAVTHAMPALGTAAAELLAAWLPNPSEDAATIARIMNLTSTQTAAQNNVTVMERALGIAEKREEDALVALREAEELEPLRPWYTRSWLEQTRQDYSVRMGARERADADLQRARNAAAQASSNLATAESDRNTTRMAAGVVGMVMSVGAAYASVRARVMASDQPGSAGAPAAGWDARVPRLRLGAAGAAFAATYVACTCGGMSVAAHAALIVNAAVLADVVAVPLWWRGAAGRPAPATAVQHPVVGIMLSMVRDPFAIAVSAGHVLAPAAVTWAASGLLRAEPRRAAWWVGTAAVAFDAALTQYARWSARQELDAARLDPFAVVPRAAAAAAPPGTSTWREYLSPALIIVGLAATIPIINVVHALWQSYSDGEELLGDFVVEYVFDKTTTLVSDLALEVLPIVTKGTPGPGGARNWTAKDLADLFDKNKEAIPPFARAALYLLSDRTDAASVPRPWNTIERSKVDSMRQELIKALGDIQSSNTQALTAANFRAMVVAELGKLDEDSKQRWREVGVLTAGESQQESSVGLWDQMKLALALRASAVDPGSVASEASWWLLLSGGTSQQWLLQLAVASLPRFWAAGTTTEGVTRAAYVAAMLCVSGVSITTLASTLLPIATARDLYILAAHDNILSATLRPFLWVYVARDMLRDR